MLHRHNRIALLTKRERQIAELLAIGVRNERIAAKFAISAKTVDTHRAHILKKLGAANNTVLARIAIRDGLVPPLAPAELTVEKPARKPYRIAEEVDLQAEGVA
jgi:DNA-binding CsgD family transcriptional regulator